MPVAEPRSPWVQGLPWALEPLLLGKASGGLHLTPDHRGVGARVEGVGKAFTPPSEPENFRFLKKERPVARPCSSPVCEMNQGDTDCDIPPLQEAKKKKKKSVHSELKKAASSPQAEAAAAAPASRPPDGPAACGSPACLPGVPAPASAARALSVCFRAWDGWIPPASPSGICSPESHHCPLCSRRDVGDLAALPSTLSSVLRRRTRHEACHLSLWK